MTWKKIDDAAVGADEPLDAYVLQGMEANANAALTDRPSSCGMAWADGHRIRLACAQTVGVLLGTWRVTPGFESIEVRLHHDVSDAAVNLGLTLLLADGPRESETPIQVGVGTSIETTLTVSGLRPYWGRVVTLLMLINSEEGDHATGSPAAPAIAARGGKITLSAGHGITLSTTERYTLAVSPDPSGAGAEDNEGFPFPVTLQKFRTTMAGELVMYTWPWVPGAEIAEWNNAVASISVIKLGQSLLYGYTIRESDPQPYAEITERLRPGRSPAASAIGRLYANNRQTFSNQARILHCGPSLDPEDLDSLGDIRCLWGPLVSHSSTAWKAVGSCLVGHYDKSVLDPSGAATDQVRSTLVVQGHVMAMYGGPNHNRELLVDLRVRLLSFSGGSWSGSVVESETLTVPLRSRIRNWNPWNDPVTQIWSFGQQGEYMTQSDLRWAWPLVELGNSWQAGLMPFAIQVTDTEVAATDRLLLLEIRGQADDMTGTRVSPDAASLPYYVCPSFTARIRPGIKGVD